jgi:hypothetical protein
MITDEKLIKLTYENVFKNLYKHKDEANEGIYLLLSTHPAIMKYLTVEEKAGVSEIILNVSNSIIKSELEESVKLK